MWPLPDRAPEVEGRVCLRVAPCASTPTTTRSTPPPSGAGSRCGSPPPRSRRRCSTAACPPTPAASPATAPLTSPAHAAALRAAPTPSAEEVRSPRWPATTPCSRHDQDLGALPSLPRPVGAGPPAAARALPKLAERAAGEVVTRALPRGGALDRGGLARDPAGSCGCGPPSFPVRETLKEFDFTFQRSVRKQVIEHLGQLDFLPLQGERGPPRTAGDRQDAL